MLALQTAYGITFLPDLSLTLVTHMSNFFDPFTPLGINIDITKYLIKIQNSYELHVRWKYANYSDGDKLLNLTHYHIITSWLVYHINSHPVFFLVQLEN
jgi:hypothetical protein